MDVIVGARAENRVQAIYKVLQGFIIDIIFDFQQADHIRIHRRNRCDDLVALAGELFGSVRAAAILILQRAADGTAARQC